MKSVLFRLATGVLTLLTTHSFVTADAPEHLVKDGIYLALQAETYVDPEDPSAKWFHENRLLIRKDDAILDKVPVVVGRGKKGYSASDGGFFTYRGRFSKKDGQIFVALRLCQSDYVIFPADKHDQYTEIKTFPVKVISGRLEFDGATYKPAKLKKIERTRLEQLLSAEPVEKNDAK
jgi:hypothetical protein